MSSRLINSTANIAFFSNRQKAACGKKARSRRIYNSFFLQMNPFALIVLFTFAKHTYAHTQTYTQTLGDCLANMSTFCSPSRECAAVVDRNLHNMISRSVAIRVRVPESRQAVERAIILLPVSRRVLIKVNKISIFYYRS